jgi:hypothetical protein
VKAHHEEYFDFWNCGVGSASRAFADPQPTATEIFNLRTENAEKWPRLGWPESKKKNHLAMKLLLQGLLQTLQPTTT